jgi:peroxiredoxin
MFYRRLCIIVALCLAAGAGIWGLQDALRFMLARSVRIGDRVQAFSARTLDGAAVRIDPAGQKTLLVFFKIDCPHCHDQLASAERIARTYAGAGLRVIGLARTDHEALRKQVFSFPVYIDQGNAMVGRFGRVMVPTLAMVDESGIVRYIRSGVRSFEMDRDTVDAFLRGALAGVRSADRLTLLHHRGTPR